MARTHIPIVVIVCWILDKLVSNDIATAITNLMQFLMHLFYCIVFCWFTTCSSFTLLSMLHIAESKTMHALKTNHHTNFNYSSIHYYFFKCELKYKH